MKKQVIIDKGNGLQQRLSYDDSTNKIIPELNIGQSSVDNVLPVVGKKFIKETGLLSSRGEDCIFCKGKKNISGIPFNTQCELLNGIQASYSPIAGTLHQSSFYSLDYNGIAISGFKFQLIFYDIKGVPVKYVEANPYWFPINFYLHQNSIYRVEIRVKKGKIYGECRLKIILQGQPVLNLYKDPLKMDIIIDRTKKLALYTNKNPSANLNYVYLIFNDSINSAGVLQYKLEHGVIRDFPFLSSSIIEGWRNNGVEDLLNYEETHKTQRVCILNYEDYSPFGMYSNFNSTIDGNL